MVPEIIKVQHRNAKIMHIAGLITMIMNKIRRSFKQYSNPRPFSTDDIKRNVDYVIKVVSNWEKVAKSYTGKENPFLNASILEIGPGPDLGTGIILKSLGAKSYDAIDMFPLASNAPKEFYDSLFDAIEHYPFFASASEGFSEFSSKGFSDNFNYQQVLYPSLEPAPKGQFDIILSQAVWEHIADPESTLIRLTGSLKEGGLFINVVDLKAHTRFIRDIDPLNNLRYKDSIYNLLSFQGTPNRMLPSDYLMISIKAGLRDIQFIPERLVDRQYIISLKPLLPGRFKEKTEEDLAILSCWWLANKPEIA